MRRHNKPTERRMIQSKNVEDNMNAYNGKRTTKDREYMNEQIIQHLKYLKDNIKEYQILYNHRFKSEDQRNVMTEFVKYLKDKNGIDIFLMKKREMKKSNEDERNVVINRLIVEFPNIFTTFLRNFF